jgi:hypothetical protein
MLYFVEVYALVAVVVLLPILMLLLTVALTRLGPVVSSYDDSKSEDGFDSPSRPLKSAPELDSPVKPAYLEAIAHECK